MAGGLMGGGNAGTPNNPKKVENPQNRQGSVSEKTTGEQVDRTGQPTAETFDQESTTNQQQNERDQEEQQAEQREKDRLAGEQEEPAAPGPHEMKRGTAFPVNPNTIGATGGAGMFPVNLAELSELYANLRDGNYYSAFKRCVEILHSVFCSDAHRRMMGENVPTRRVAGNVVSTGVAAVDTTQLEDYAGKIEQWVQGAETDRSMMATSAEPGNTGIGIDEIMTLVTVLLRVIQGWRKK